MQLVDLFAQALEPAWLRDSRRKLLGEVVSLGLWFFENQPREQVLEKKSEHPLAFKPGRHISPVDDQTKRTDGTNEQPW